MGSVLTQGFVLDYLYSVQSKLFMHEFHTIREMIRCGRYEEAYREIDRILGRVKK